MSKNSIPNLTTAIEEAQSSFGFPVFGPHFVRYGVPPKPVKIDYPDIVDRSNYSPGTTLQSFDQQSAELNMGSYDYPDGKVKERVNPVLVAIRSGRLQQPDIDKLVDALTVLTQQQSDKDAADAAQKQLDAINSARQDHLDNLTEFDKSSVSE